MPTCTAIHVPACEHGDDERHGHKTPHANATHLQETTGWRAWRTGIVGTGTGMTTASVFTVQPIVPRSSTHSPSQGNAAPASGGRIA